MEFTPEQLTVIHSENPKTELELKGVEILAVFSLGQMHNKIVRMSNIFGNSTVGLFRIESLNGKSDLDFSNPDDWKNVAIQDIFVSLLAPNEFGGKDKRSFNNLFDIQSIEWLAL